MNTTHYEVDGHVPEYKVKTDVYTELLRRRYLNKLVKRFIELCDGKLVVNGSDEEKNRRMLHEVHSIFIFTKETHDDVFFTETSMYDPEKVVPFLRRQRVQVSGTVLSAICRRMDAASNECYKKVSKVRKGRRIAVRVDTSGGRYVNLSLEGVSGLEKYYRYFNLTRSVYGHLRKLYTVNNHGYGGELADLDEFHRRLYLVFYRYYSLSAGSTQASVLPRFKLLFKKYLGIKVELFGSAINTSSFRYGSIFTDVERYFGSLGSFFDMDIRRGFFELNPPFDPSIINRVYERLSSWLSKGSAELLFLVVLPTSLVGDDGALSGFLRARVDLEKGQFPYVHYKYDFSQSRVRAIVDTTVSIYHNDFVKEVQRNNVQNFARLLLVEQRRVD